MPATPGIHHITAISGPAQENVDFYVGVLGLRLVKKTVNFDDPGTYHLYYGNERGRPGSIMTFFPWPDAVPGRAGAGMVAATAYTVSSAHALEFWMGRFADLAIAFDGPAERLGRPLISLRDPDGFVVEIVGDDDTPPAADTPDAASGGDEGTRSEEVTSAGVVIPNEHAIRGFHAPALHSAAPAETVRVLTDILGFSVAAEKAGRTRCIAAEDGIGRMVDVVPSSDRGRTGSGIIHHIAFRARDDEEQLAWREEIASSGLHVTDVKDRQYFRSIYFREPGGVLFEIATDGPGFTADESFEELGTALRLPQWLEGRRSGIETRLSELSVPRRGSARARPSDI